MQNTNKNADPRYFRLSDFYLAAFLSAKGLELVSIERSEGRRAYFVFRDTPIREPLVHNFNFAKEDAAEVLTDARKLIVAIRALKDKLYQGET